MSSLIWLPIDVPRLPDLGNLIIPNERWGSFAWWRFLRLTENERASENYNVTDWLPWVREECPQLVSWFDNLPFLSIRHVKINMQTRPVTRHVDFTNPLLNPHLWKNNRDNEPCGYRILIRGSRTNATWVERSDGSRVSCTMPDDTDTYVLNHTSGPHGVDDDNDRMLIFLYAEIDPSRHSALLAKSLARYGDHAVWNS